MSEQCLNPLCGSDFTPYGHGRPQKFCPGRRCKMDAWVLKRAAELLSPLPTERKLEILAGLCPGSENHGEITVRTTGNNQYEINGRKKTYLCQRWPFLTIEKRGKRVKFQGGYFETEDPELQALIESRGEYGALILEVDTERVKVNPTNSYS